MRIWQLNEAPKKPFSYSLCHQITLQQLSDRLSINPGPKPYSSVSTCGIWTIRKTMTLLNLLSPGLYHLRLDKNFSSPYRHVVSSTWQQMAEEILLNTGDRWCHPSFVLQQFLKIPILEQLHFYSKNISTGTSTFDCSKLYSSCVYTVPYCTLHKATQAKPSNSSVHTGMKLTMLQTVSPTNAPAKVLVIADTLNTTANSIQLGQFRYAHRSYKGAQ